jgi:hypothetical protein
MTPCHSGETKCWSTCQEISYIFWNTNIHYNATFKVSMAVKFLLQCHSPEYLNFKFITTFTVGCQCCVYKKVKKVKFSLCLTKHHAMKAYCGSGGIAPRILDLGTRCRWVVSFTPRPLYLKGKSRWYPLNRRLGGPQSRSGCSGEEKNFQPLPGPRSSSP